MNHDDTNPEKVLDQIELRHGLRQGAEEAQRLRKTIPFIVEAATEAVRQLREALAEELREIPEEELTDEQRRFLINYEPPKLEG